MILSALGFVHGAFAEDDIHGSVHLTHVSTDTDTDGVKASTWQFTQVYNLGVRKAFTPKVGLTADLDVNVTESNDTKTTRLAPDVRLDVTNEYFDANTGYRINERGLDILTMTADEDRRTTEAWNANIATKSEKYPKVRLRYNEDKDYDHLVVRQTDTKATNFSGSADYSYRFLNFNYEYRDDETENYVTESTQNNDTQEGRVNFRKSFWDNMVTTSGSYSITERNTETTTGGQTVTESEKQNPADGLYAYDTIPATGALLTGRSELINGDTGTIVSSHETINIGGTSTDQNIGVDMDSQTEIDEIRVYTEDVSFAVTPAIWEIYYSDDNDNWTQITTSTSFTYDTTEDRFEISFAKTTARYFKVVNILSANNLPGNDLFVTEIEAYDSTTYAAFTTTKTERTTQTTQANLGYKPTDWLSFTYDFTQDEQKTEPDQKKTTRDAHNVSGRVERELHKYLTAWAQYRRRWANDSEADDTTTDTYLLHFLSSPLDTLDTDLSLNHTESKAESVTQSRSSSALFQIAAKLREGADLDVDANVIRTENLVGNSETTTRSLDSNLRLELTRMLTAEIEYNRNWTKTEQPTGDTDGETSYGKTTLYWRPSHDFYLRGAFSVDRNEKTGAETTQQQYNMNWLMSEKMQLDMGYTVDDNETDSQTYTSDLSWNLSRILTFRFGYDWSRQESDTITETQTITTDLSGRF